MVKLDEVDKVPLEKYNKFYKHIRLGISSGRGVFSKKEFKKGEIIEIAPYTLDKGAAFNDYIFTSHVPDYESLIVFGYGSMYNHSDTPNVGYVLKHSTSTNDVDSFFVYYAKQDIKQDEECKINYGKDWWTTRSIKQQGGSKSKSKRYCLRE